MDVSFGRQFSECIFWESDIWMYLLGGSFLNVSFGRQFSVYIFWQTVLGMCVLGDSSGCIFLELGF